MCSNEAALTVNKNELSSLRCQTFTEELNCSDGGKHGESRYTQFTQMLYSALCGLLSDDLFIYCTVIVQMHIQWHMTGGMTRHCFSSDNIKYAK